MRRSLLSKLSTGLVSVADEARGVAGDLVGNALLVAFGVSLGVLLSLLKYHCLGAWPW